MRIIWIEKLFETEHHHITKAKFQTMFGRECINICLTKKGGTITKFFSTGEDIPVKLWDSFNAFLESNRSYFST